MYQYIGLILLLLSAKLSAQHHKDTIHNSPSPIIKNLKDFLLKGHTSGHVRNYFMATINNSILQDYYTNAIGGAITYHSANLYGLEFGVKGIFSFKTFSADLTAVDPLSQRHAIWEVELYDITRPQEGLDLDRLEELYIKYTYRNSNFSFGKIDINKSPLLLKRDGRMKPFVYNGAWLAIKEITKHHFYWGWLYQVSPRGMTEWYPIDEAIGILNNGYQPNGQKAHYQHHLKSAGLGVFGYEGTIANALQLKLWNYTLDKINNTVWLQAAYKFKNWYSGIQYVFQVALPHQASLPYNNRYQQPNEIAHVLATQLGYLFQNKLNVSFAYSHNFKGGRFLFPKEMGREDFYTSHPRSWLEGYANRNDYLLRIVYYPLQKKKQLSLDLKLAWVDLPSAKKYQDNKYEKTDYFQTTLEIDYAFSNLLNGLTLKFLYIYRSTPKTYYLPLEKEFYNTNLHHFNLITEINF